MATPWGRNAQQRGCDTACASFRSEVLSDAGRVPLFWVLFTDLYIRLVASGAITDPRFF